MTYADFLNFTANYDVDDLSDFIRTITGERIAPGFSSFSKKLFGTYLLSYPSGSYLYLDPMMSKIIGYELTEIKLLVPNPSSKLWYAPDQKIQNEIIMATNLWYFRQIEPKYHDRYLITTNYRVRHKNGHLINVQQQSYYIRTALDGTPLVTLGYITDLTRYGENNKIIHSIENVLPENYKGKKPFYAEYYSDSISIELGKLSPREQEVLKLIGEGLRDLEIANKMSISIKTVEKHKAKLREKANVKTTAELIMRAKK